MNSVKYLKALYGFGGESVICGPGHNKKSWELMANDIGGTTDWVAIYLPQKADVVSYRGYIGAYLQINTLNQKTIYDYGKECLQYGWNANQWPVGVPAYNWRRIPRDEALDLKQLIMQSNRPQDWDSMKALLRNGPINLSQRFPYLESILSQHLHRVQKRLIPV